MARTSDVVCLRPAKAGDERRVTRFLAVAVTDVANAELQRLGDTIEFRSNVSGAEAALPVAS